MPLIGSDGGFQADNRGGLIDELGNTVVSSRTTFGASPLGVAARTQALYGIPNANFNLTPPEPADPIVANQNDLPYWSIENLSDGQITATTVFDATTQTWGVELNPGTAASGSTLSLTTRSYLITDDNLALRQKAQAVLSKSGTAAVSTQWNLTLSATYYDSTDTALSTAIIGTALDTGTWTSLAGTTTPGGSAINAAAQYVDLAFTLTTTAAVTGSAKATIKSLLLSTSTPSSQSFLVTETFTSSTTWTRPTGVNYLVAVVACGGGGGGGGGALRSRSAASGNTDVGSGAGGGAGRWVIYKDLYVGDQSTVSIGVGTGGAGGTATTFSKAAAGTATLGATTGGVGGSGGATSFGSYFSVGGGSGGVSVATDAETATGGAAGGAGTTIVYGVTTSAGGGGGNGGNSSNSTVGGTGGFSGFTIIPYSTAIGSCASGSASTGTGGSRTVGTAGVSTTTGWIGGGGGGGSITSTAGNVPTVNLSRGGRSGGGGGGESLFIATTATATISGTAGVGGPGATSTGSGGGAGGSLLLSAIGTAQQTAYDASTLTLSSGAGGAGADGFLTVVYVA